MKDIVLAAVWTLFFLLVPAGVVWLCRRSKAAARVGAILILYFVGLVVGNLLIYPFTEGSKVVAGVQEALSSITIPLALPLILFACDFRGWPVKKALASLVIGLFSVLIASMAGYFLLSPHLGGQAAAVTGMAVGVYTGGTPNLAAIKMMLRVDEGTYLLMNSFDMLVSFLYLVFLMSVGIKLFRKFLPAPGANAEEVEEQHLTAMATSEDRMYREVFSRENRSGTLKALGLAVLITGLSLGLSMLTTGGINMIVLILTLTTLAIGASFIPNVRGWSKSYDAGMYLVLVFSLVVASMVDIRSLNFGEGIWLLAFVALVIFGSLLLQVLLCKLFRIDADTATITSVAMINSPLFVPMIAANMKNRRVILTGIAIGIIGYAAGNYLGVLVAGILGG